MKKRGGNFIDHLTAIGKSREVKCTFEVTSDKMMMKYLEYLLPLH